MGNIAVFSEVVGGGALLIAGILQIVTRKAIGVDKERFTEESLRKYAVVMGIFMIIMGFTFIAIFEGMTGLLTGKANGTYTMIGDIVMITMITFWMLFSKGILVEKKKTGRTKFANNKKKRRK